MKSKSKTLVQNTKWIYISKISTQLLNLVATILVIRQLDVEIFGIYNLLLNSFVIFHVFALSAIKNVFNRYIPELIENREFVKFKIMILYGLLFSSFICIVFIILLYVFQSTFAEVFNIYNFSKYLVVYIIFIFSNFYKIIIDTILKTLLLHKRVAFISIFNILVRTILYIILLQKLDINMLLYIEVLLAVIFIAQGTKVYAQYVRSLPDTYSTIGSPVTFKRVRKYGFLSFANELGVGIIGVKSDYFIIAAFSNPHMVGIFAFAHRIYGMVYRLLPFKDFQTVLRPLFFQKYTNKYKINDFRVMYAFITKALLPFYMFPGVFFLFFGKNIINIVFDPKYKESYLIILVILCSNMIIAFFFSLSLTAYLKERMDILLYSKIIVIFSVVGAILGMKLFGVLGVVLASLIGNLLKNLCVLFLMREYPEIKYNFNDYSKFLVLLILLSPFAIFINLELSAISLTMYSLFFVVYSFLAFVIFHPFHSKDIELIKKLTNSTKTLKVISSFFEKFYTYVPRF